MTQSSLTLVTQPDHFFRDLVVDAMGNQKVESSQEVQVYLVNILAQFVAKDDALQQPVFELLKEAVEQEDLESQKREFRRMGDVTLYTAGFFQGSLNRKLVDVDYYIQMGGKAYAQVATWEKEDVGRRLYTELATKFATYVDIFAEVSEKTNCESKQDLLRTYELWMETGSAHAEKKLIRAGIVPDQQLKKKVQ